MAARPELQNFDAGALPQEGEDCVRVQIGFESGEAAAKTLREMADEVEATGLASKRFILEGGGSDAELEFEVVNEGSDEFAEPSATVYP